MFGFGYVRRVFGHKVIVRPDKKSPETLHQIMRILRALEHMSKGGRRDLLAHLDAMLADWERRMDVHEGAVCMLNGPFHSSLPPDTELQVMKSLEEASVVAAYPLKPYDKS